MNEADDALLAWLDAGQAWLARVGAAGLSCAAPALLAEGRAWAETGALLGWETVADRVGRLTDSSSALPERARAFLDLCAWLATAVRLNEVAGLDAADESAESAGFSPFVIAQPPPH